MPLTGDSHNGGNTHAKLVLSLISQHIFQVFKMTLTANHQYKEHTILILLYCCYIIYNYNLAEMLQIIRLWVCTILSVVWCILKNTC